MKKILILGTMFLVALVANAQLMETEELEKYAKEKFGDNWEQAAMNISKEIQLDKNNGLTYTRVIEAPGKTKNELYVMVNYWYTQTFNSANTQVAGKSQIQLNDREAGAIISRGWMSKVASHKGGLNQYQVNLAPVIKTDIRDGKVRVTYTVPYLDVQKIQGGGLLGSAANRKYVEEKWTFDQCYPFVEKDAHMRTSSKAFVMAHAYSNVILDKIEEAVKGGLVGNESDDW